jgi:hypothetical protein
MPETSCLCLFNYIKKSDSSQRNAKMASPARLISINNHRVLFSDTEHRLFNTLISQSNLPRSDSDVSTLPETTILHIPPEITDQILTYLPLEDKACFIISCSHFYTRYQIFFQDKRLQECRPIDMSGDYTLAKRPKIIFRKGAVNIRLKLNYSGDWKMRT